MSVLDASDDFADGLITYDGNWLGGENFVSFEKKAVKSAHWPRQVCTTACSGKANDRPGERGRQDRQVR
ncbi:hypothetical protein QE369_001929 [Agrobacterium larrymoorei]|uniref:Uncharacterized protein n=1 Tax=Agrobacterium larrymoorei TaxID=160699 RepID=A0AAJ2BBR8_9HYPH|nr:hypothetical protein [Agrobacterium larrymoorei]